MEVKMADKKLRITLVKSPISAVPKHRRTVEAMGLTKMHKTVELPDPVSPSPRPSCSVPMCSTSLWIPTICIR